MAELTHERLTEQEISEGLKICPHGCGCIRRRALLQIQATNIIGACGHSWDGSLHRACPRCAIKSCEVWMKSFADRWESVRRESAPSGEDFGNSTVLRIANEALTELANGMPTSELLERRKAEECLKCEGKRFVVVADTWSPGHTEDVQCSDCHGTGKQGNAESRHITALVPCDGSTSCPHCKRNPGPSQGNAELIAALQAHVKFHSALADECKQDLSDFSRGRSYGISCLVDDIKKSIEQTEGK